MSYNHSTLPAPLNSEISTINPAYEEGFRFPIYQMPQLPDALLKELLKKFEIHSKSNGEIMHITCLNAIEHTPIVSLEELLQCTQARESYIYNLLKEHDLRGKNIVTLFAHESYGCFSIRSVGVKKPFKFRRTVNIFKVNKNKKSKLGGEPKCLKEHTDSTI